MSRPSRREGFAGGIGSLEDDRSLAKELRRPAAQVPAQVPPSSDPDPERLARRRLVKMQNAKARYGEQSVYSLDDIEQMRASVRELAGERPSRPSARPQKPEVVRAPQPVPPPAFLASPITWLDVPVMIGPTRSCAVVGYDSRLGAPAWLAAVLAEAA